MRLRPRTALFAAALVVSFVSAAAGTPSGASPEQELRAKTAEAERIQARIDELHERADVLNEAFLQAQDAAAHAQQQIDVARAAVAQAEAETASVKRRLGGRAAFLYMGSAAGEPLTIDVADVRELGARAKYSEAAAEQDGRLIDDLRLAEEQLAIEQEALAEQMARAEAQRQEVDAARAELEDATAEAEQLLASVQGEMRDLVARVERDRRAAEEAEARAAAERAAAQAASTGGSTSPGPGLGGGGVDPSTIPAPSPGAQQAVAYAYAQLGKPYRYAGVGPDAFDCSGLTMMAWAQGGVSMAHGSQAQYMAFPKVPVDQLQPGDLVFFGDSGPTNHHVAIVVEPGMMIDAPHTGAYVHKVSYYRRDLVPLGVRPG
jgi:cell wall-associated NlpC family hydrolase